MRYQEAYEMVEAGLSKSALGFPITEPLISSFFDNKVQEVGGRVVRKRGSQELSTTTTNVYTLTNEDASMRIYKVTLIGSSNSKAVPYVSEKRYSEGADEGTIQNIGYFVSEENSSTGTITGATSANPIVITSSSHGLETGDKVKITGIVGLLSGTGAKSEVNDVVHEITVTSANAFSIPVKGAAYGTAYSSSTGTWTSKDIKLTLTKTPDSGSTLKVYYYAKPMPKNAITDGVDLPDQLVPACVHYALAHFLFLDSQMKMGSGHYGLAEKIEKEFIETRNSREAKPDIIPPPLQDFIF